MARKSTKSGEPAPTKKLTYLVSYSHMGRGAGQFGFGSMEITARKALSFSDIQDLKKRVEDDSGVNDVVILGFCKLRGTK